MTPESIGPEMLRHLFTESIPKGIILAYQMIWNFVNSFLLDNWIIVLISLIGVLVYAIFRALMGHWWVLGSVLYTYFYWGIIWIIGFIWGPEVFAGVYADLGLFALYVFCFILVGIILHKSGVRRIK